MKHRPGDREASNEPTGKRPNRPYGGTWWANLRWRLAALEIVESDDLKRLHSSAREFLRLLERIDESVATPQDLELLTCLEMVRGGKTLMLKRFVFPDLNFLAWYEVNTEFALNLLARCCAHSISAPLGQGSSVEKLTEFIARTPGFFLLGGEFVTVHAGITGVRPATLREIALAFCKANGTDWAGEDAVKLAMKRSFDAETRFRAKVEARLRRALSGPS